MQNRGMEGKGEKKRRKKVVRGKERKEREKEEFSSGSFPPCPPHREEKKPPQLSLQPPEDADWPPQRCPGHPTEMVTTPSPRTLRTPAMAKHRPWHFKPSSRDASPHQPAPPARDFNPWSSKQHPSSPSGFHYPLQRTKGGSPPPSNPPEILGVLQAAGPEAHSLVGLVSAAEADSAIRLIEKGARSREQLPVAYVLVRHLLLLIWGLIKANAVMVTLLFDRFFQWLASKKRKAIKEKAEIDRCAEPGRASHGVSQGCRGLAQALGRMQEGWLLQELPSLLRKGAVQTLRAQRLSPRELKASKHRTDTQRDGPASEG